MRLVMIGAGAIGGVVGACLAEAGHEVVLVARGPHGQAIVNDGLHVASPDRSIVLELDVAPDVSALDWGDDDVALLAVKSQDTVTLLDALAAVAPPDLPVVCFRMASTTSVRRFDDSSVTMEQP